MPSASNMQEYAIQQRLLLITVLGSIVISVALSLYFAYTSAQKLSDYHQSMGLQISKSLAEQLRIPIYNNDIPAIANKLDDTLALPGISSITLFYPDGKVLLRQSDDQSSQSEQPKISLLRTNQTSVQLSHSHKDFWLYQGQILSIDNDQANLAHIAITQNKHYVHALESSIIKQHIITGIIYGFLLAMITYIMLSRILRPLAQLRIDLRSIQPGYYRTIKTRTNAQEVRLITNTINQFIEEIKARDIKLIADNENLESIVAQRTKQLEITRDKALAAAKEKSRFLSNMSHELRTPLQSVIGYCDIVCEQLSDAGIDDCAEDMQRIQDNSNHLLKLINSTLALSKLETSSQILRLKPAKINDIINRLESTISPLLKTNNNQFKAEYQGDHSEILIDETKLLQILLNLSGNAIKFTHNGNVSVLAIQNESSLIITVTDDGIGIPENQQKEIFSAYRQVEGSVLNKLDGIGLGLAISKYFCVLMGGDISVQSTISHGSTFTVQIPLPINTPN